jgi:hypothetical protein
MQNPAAVTVAPKKIQFNMPRQFPVIRSSCPNPLKKRACDTKTNHFFSASEKRQHLSAVSPAEAAVQRRKISATDISSLLQKSLNQHFYHFDQREKSSTVPIISAP